MLNSTWLPRVWSNSLLRIVVQQRTIGRILGAWCMVPRVYVIIRFNLLLYSCSVRLQWSSRWWKQISRWGNSARRQFFTSSHSSTLSLMIHARHLTCKALMSPWKKASHLANNQPHDRVCPVFGTSKPLLCQRPSTIRCDWRGPPETANCWSMYQPSCAPSLLHFDLRMAPETNDTKLLHGQMTWARLLFILCACGPKSGIYKNTDTSQVSPRLTGTFLLPKLVLLSWSTWLSYTLWNTFFAGKAF